jgi:HK97 family phage major capsid protein
MKKLIEARDSKEAELINLVEVLDTLDVSAEGFNDKFDRSKALHIEVKDLNEKIEEAREATETLKLVKESRNNLGVEDEDLGDKEAIVEVNEPALYRKEGAHSFIKDAYSSRRGDFSAQERLNSHQEYEARDVGTGAFTGLVVPQYLLDMYAPIARAGSAFYNAASKEQLPDFGNQIEISRITTGSTTAPQAAENTAVSETNIDDTLLTVPVNTIAGQQDVSRQALERGGASGFSLENVIFQDLLSAYYTTMDSQMWTGTGANGQHTGMIQVTGIGAISYTDASPTVAEAFPKLANAVQTVNSNRFAPATAIFMHPRRWGFFTAGVDSTNRPLVLPLGNNPDNAVGVGEAAKYGNVVGTLLGLPVITDANVQTNGGAGGNEDLLWAIKMDDLKVFEDGVMQLKFEETNAGNLTTKMVVYGYSAFASGRYPAGAAYVSGTGFVPPTF